jgi:hypothetical protein
MEVTGNIILMRGEIDLVFRMCVWYTSPPQGYEALCGGSEW